jgi:hypothetical protein
MRNAVELTYIGAWISERMSTRTTWFGMQRRYSVDFGTVLYWGSRTAVLDLEYGPSASNADDAEF